jgi:SAM-dependent methyltransferase
MPSASPSSQPSPPPPAWLQGEAGRQLLADVQRDALPEMTRVFGQHGLYLRPSNLISSDLSGNMLARVVSLWRAGSGFRGDVDCLDAEIPIASASLSLVYALFVVEGAPSPAVLLHEFARMLKPEGVVLVLSLNPWSPAQFRWLRPPASSSSNRLERLAHEAGLEVMRRQFLGPFWPAARPASLDLRQRGLTDAFRAARLTVLRRREAALTPLRKATGAVSLRPGMSAG